MEKLIYRRGAVGATDAILDKTVLLSTGKSDIYCSRDNVERNKLNINEGEDLKNEDGT